MTGKKEYKSKAPAQLQIPMGCTLDANGHLVVVDMFDFSIALFDTGDGKYIKKYGRFGEQDGQFMYPSDIDYDVRTDTFVVADTGMARAQIIQLPNTGGNMLTKARSLLNGPLFACLIPILIILVGLAIALWLMRRRRKKDAENMALILADAEGPIA